MRPLTAEDQRWNWGISLSPHPASVGYVHHHRSQRDEPLSLYTFPHKGLQFHSGTGHSVTRAVLQVPQESCSVCARSSAALAQSQLFATRGGHTLGILVTTTAFLGTQEG